MEDNKTWWIELKGLKFFGHYGTYPVEKKWNQCIVVDICISLPISNKSELMLEDTLDYQIIYSMVERICKKPSELLESIGIQLINELINKFPQIREIQMGISKKVLWAGPGLPVKIRVDYKKPEV